MMASQATRTSRRTLGVPFISPVTVAAALIGVAAAVAAPAGDLGFDFVTIGDPGNPAWAGTGDPFFDEAAGRGGVDYEFRIMRTEVTATQWFEFVLAYAPYVGDQRSSPRFTSDVITFIGPGADGVPQYRLNLGGDDLPVNVGWRFAARFCNWLHNGKAPEREAFESGAYDTSTFGEVSVWPFVLFTDQPRHTLGARFWIPTVDEWTKAAYWDPDKNGPGKGGWWTQPNGSDEPLIPGLPGVGQTSAGAPSGTPMPPVGSYPEVNKPWGLLDVSGSQEEWMEDYFSIVLPLDRTRKLSRANTMHHEVFDAISELGSASPKNADMGLRLASAAPPQKPLGSADLNRDGVVNGFDLLMLLSAWGPCGHSSIAKCVGDLNNDFRVDTRDLIVVLEQWSGTP